MNKKMSGSEIRQSFIEFFEARGHTFVPSSSLVPGGDATLLFTNAGMVQFKDVFLGTDKRPYTRAVNSQKCMRVAGKHNDLDDVGRDDSHHTFFEMLGNWSFGDYYKKEAIAWAWELLTQVWGVDSSKLYATCFKDDKGQIPTDEEAYENWTLQPGMIREHILFFGRKENFWEMADTGPCGPCSEIHIDRGAEYCNKKDVPGHVCRVNGDCTRYLEIWNLVFMQYNRTSETNFLPLPATHVDTGMGLDRIVAIIQGKDSNYRTDMFSPMMEKIRELSRFSTDEMNANFTPFRVVADHIRAATFLIADGVVPGNTGRNYVCRMIIRRAARFASKIGLNDPFMAKVAEVVVENYGTAYPELEKNKATILENLTREEKRFQKTVEAGMGHLDDLLNEVKAAGQTVLDGAKAFDLYATHGLPVELTRDVAREQNLDVDEAGFRKAMEEHKINSGAGKAFGAMGGEDVDVYRHLFEDLKSEHKLDASGVKYNPYEWLTLEEKVLAIVKDGEVVDSAVEGDEIAVILPQTGFYIESGGQVADTGTITAKDGSWKVAVSEARRPAAGVIVHLGKVVKGTVRAGEDAVAEVDHERRLSIMRNHTATHLLHAALQKRLGSHARQAGSLVAPDRLRFDFTHPEAVPTAVLDEIEADVNRDILANFPVSIKVKPREQAMAEGAMALFGEKYGANVRTVTIDPEHPVSYELCGGTHMDHTGDIGTFLIISEGSAAAGIRRIEAVTGTGAYEVIRARSMELRKTAQLLNAPMDDVFSKVVGLSDTLDDLRKELAGTRQDMAINEFKQKLDHVRKVKDVTVLSTAIQNADADLLRQLTDIFKQKAGSGVVVVGSVTNDRPMIICAVTDDLVKVGINAGSIVREAAEIMGGSGGGRPNMAQAGGKDAAKLGEALEAVYAIIERMIK
ncbi:MAG: alanine--tRNA ligase [Anaerolineaceae bacterium]